MSTLDGETESGRRIQVTEETVWVKTQSQGYPSSGLFVPNCPFSPWVGELRFRKSGLSAVDEEAKQTNKQINEQFLKISAPKEVPKKRLFAPLSNVPRRQQLSQEGRRKLVTGGRHLACWRPSRKPKLATELRSG